MRLAGENRREAGAENRKITPSPNRRENGLDYIKWRFKWCDEGFGLNTDIRYACLDLHKYLRSQKVIDRIGE